jgi:hypothetical protein
MVAVGDGIIRTDVLFYTLGSFLLSRQPRPKTRSFRCIACVPRTSFHWTSIL